MPGFLAYVVFAIEALAGIAFILGFQTRVFAAIAVPVLIGATWAHIGNGWLFTNTNGGWEYPMLLVFATIAQALLGDGAFALKLPTKAGNLKAVRA